jgi:hypothetical protein
LARGSHLVSTMRLSSVSILSIVATTTTLLASSPNARALDGTTRTFPFDDARLLLDGERDGGLVWVGERAHHEGAPLLVFLHGANGDVMHRWLGGSGDVRKIVAAWSTLPGTDPPIVAGPSQTRDAHNGATLFADFDLDEFVDAVEAALPAGVSVDEERIVVVGHSGAGCNEEGGLVSAPSGTIAPMALVAIDTCMDASFGDRLDDATGDAPAWVFWEPRWPRPISAFRATFEDERPQLRHVVLMNARSDAAHGAIVDKALPLALNALLRDPDAISTSERGYDTSPSARPSSAP